MTTANQPRMPCDSTFVDNWPAARACSTHHDAAAAAARPCETQDSSRTPRCSGLNKIQYKLFEASSANLSKSRQFGF